MYGNKKKEKLFFLIGDYRINKKVKCSCIIAYFVVHAVE